jgi:ribonuclease HII
MVLSTGRSTRLRASVAAAPTLDEERHLWSAGHRRVGGVDEVGRGAWAGPVTVGVAVIPGGAVPAPDGLRDSKLMTEAGREAMFDRLVEWCESWGVGHASPAECDRWGMAVALRLAARRALATLDRLPDAVLVDGPHDLLRAKPADGGDRAVTAPWGPGDAAGLPRPPDVVVPVVGGDRRCASIAAASVLAKVVRDRIMRDEAAHFPPYGFDRNKGYPSPIHRTALQGYGLSAIHRRSWSYVSKLPWR